MTALNNLMVYQVEARLRAMFKCDSCGQIAAGRSIRFSSSTLMEYPGQTLGHHLSTLRGSSNDMPVGWSSRYTLPLNTHFCPNCTQE